MNEKPQDLLKNGFEVAHLGINASNPEQAAEAARKLALLFGWPVQPGKDSVFVGPRVEIMKGNGRGRHGHIGVAVDDIYAAKEILENKGWVFAGDSAKYDADGRLIVIYLQDEVAGFAVHLLQK